MNPTVTLLERLLEATGNRLDVVVTPRPIRPTLGALQSHRQEIIEIVESFGGSNVRVFGSVARGEARDNDEIDLLIDVPAGTDPATIERITEALDEVLPCQVIVVTTGAVRSRTADVIDDAVAL